MESEYAPLPAPIRQQLLELYAPHNEQLFALLGRCVHTLCPTIGLHSTVVCVCVCAHMQAIQVGCVMACAPTLPTYSFSLLAASPV